MVQSTLRVESSAVLRMLATCGITWYYKYILKLSITTRRSADPHFDSRSEAVLKKERFPAVRIGVRVFAMRRTYYRARFRNDVISVIMDALPVALARRCSAKQFEKILAVDLFEVRTRKGFVYGL